MSEKRIFIFILSDIFLEYFPLSFLGASRSLSHAIISFLQHSFGFNFFQSDFNQRLLILFGAALVPFLPAALLSHSNNISITNHHSFLQTMGRIRAEKNKKHKDGIRNRSAGLKRKAQAFHRLFGGDALLIIRAEGENFTGFQSRRGLLHEISNGPELELSGPQDLESENSRQGSPSPRPGLFRLGRASSFESASTPSELSLNTDESSSSTPGSQIPEPSKTLRLPTRAPLTAQQKEEILGILLSL